MTRNFDLLQPGQDVIVKPVGHRTGRIFRRDNGPLVRYWVRIDGNTYGPYTTTDLVHPNDTDRTGARV